VTDYFKVTNAKVLWPNREDMNMLNFSKMSCIVLFGGLLLQANPAVSSSKPTESEYEFPEAQQACRGIFILNDGHTDPKDLARRLFQILLKAPSLGSSSYKADWGDVKLSIDQATKNSLSQMAGRYEELTGYRLSGSQPSQYGRMSSGGRSRKLTCQVVLEMKNVPQFQRVAITTWLRGTKVKK